MKWTIRNKLLAAFGVVLFMFGILVIVNWFMMSSSIDATEQARDRGYAGAMVRQYVESGQEQLQPLNWQRRE